MTYYVYYGSTLLSPLSFSYSNAMKGKSSCQFTLADRRHGELATWEARVYQELVYIYKDSACIFIGYIKSVNSNNSILNINCISQIDELTWEVIEDEFVKFEIYFDQLYTDYNMGIKDSEGVTNIFTTNELTAPENFYVIVSDNTEGATEEELMEYAETKLTASGLTLSTTHAGNLEEVDANYIQVSAIDNGDYFTLKMDKESVENTNTITNFLLKIALSEYKNNTPFASFKIDWYKGSTYVATLKNISFTYSASGTYNAVYFEINQEIPTTSDWFEDGGTYWEAKLRFTFTQSSSVVTYFRLDYVSCILSHESSSFENLNRKIYSNSTNGMLVYKEDLSTYDDISDYGLNEDDKVTVTTNFNSAITKSNKSNIIMDVPTINKGVSQSYVYADSFTTITNILEEQKLEWFETIVDDYVILKAIAEEDISAATITYESGSDEPSNAETITYEPNVWGSVRVKYADGITDKRFATSPPSDPRCLIIEANWIVTKTGAEQYGDKMAEYYSTPHRSIMVKWDKDMTNLPEVGSKYNVDFLKWNDSTKQYDVYTFSDQICRRVQITWSNDGQMDITAYIGGGSTPENEKVGKEIGDLKRKNKVESGLSLTPYKATSVNWSAINNKPTTFTPISHNNDYHSETYITADDLPADTDDLSEGSTNKYYTDARARASINNVIGADGKLDSALYTDGNNIILNYQEYLKSKDSAGSNTYNLIQLYNDGTVGFPITSRFAEAILMLNNKGFYQRNVAGSNIKTSLRNSSDILEIGDSSQNTGIQINEPLYTNSKNIILDYQEYLKSKNSSGVATNLWELGNDTEMFNGVAINSNYYIYCATHYYQANNKYFYQRNSSGTNRKSMIRNSSNILEIGDATQNTGIIFNEPVECTKNVVFDAVMRFNSATELTISSGTVTITKNWHTIDTEGDAASDDLTTINGGTMGMEIIIHPASSSRTVVVKNGTGNIKCGADRTLDNYSDIMKLFYDGYNWLMVSFSDNAT